METGVKITLIIVGAIVLLAIIGNGIYFENKPGQEVTVEGISEIKAEPDIVSVYFNVETNESTAEEAKDMNSKIVDEVITELIKLGLSRDQITTSNFNVGPKYVYEDRERKQKGHEATHRIVVEIGIEDKDMAGEVIDAGVEAGSEISHINFELFQEEENNLKREALKKATEDAKSKAEGIASGLEKNLGDIVSVKSQDFNYQPWRLYDSESTDNAKETVDIQPSDKTISGRVEVIYGLK